jgi:hypothetical protein
MDGLKLCVLINHLETKVWRVNSVSKPTSFKIYYRKQVNEILKRLPALRFSAKSLQ